MNPTPNSAISEERSSSSGGSHDAISASASAQRPVALVLTEEMLARFASRAASYDHENRFFEEDFEELRDAKYLLLPLPREFGGAGMTLAEVCREQRRLAYHAPATALAVNMHLYWLGVAADLWRRGDVSLEWLLREAAAGEIFAAGHAESGNDVPVLLSTTKAEPVAGGYRFTGRKHFGSLTPVWTRFGLHGMDTSNPSEPRSFTHSCFWIPPVTTSSRPGMCSECATRSDDTVLENAFVPDRYIARVVPAGAAGIDPFVLGVFAWALMGFGNVYYGLAKRALELSISSVKSKGSLRSLAFHGVSPGDPTRHCRYGHRTRVHRTTSGDDSPRTGPTEWVNGAHWPAKIFAAKYRAVEGAWRVVDLGLEVTGGNGIFRSAGYERLVRDARLAESIQRIPSSRMRSWRRPFWVSAWMNNPAGASEFPLPALQPLGTNFSLNSRRAGWDGTKSQH